MPKSRLLSRKRSLAGKPQSRSGSPSLKVSCCGAGSATTVRSMVLPRLWPAVVAEALAGRQAAVAQRIAVLESLLLRRRQRGGGASKEVARRLDRILDGQGAGTASRRDREARRRAETTQRRVPRQGEGGGRREPCEPHPSDTFRHDRLPSYAALAPRALTRECTIAGRSFHLVCGRECTIAGRSFHLVCGLQTR